MITWLDDRFLALAKKIVSIAGFLGVSRKQVVYGWIIVTFSMIIAYLLLELPGKNMGYLSLMVWLISFGANCLYARRNYREDDLLSEIAKPSFQTARVMLVLILPALGLFDIFASPNFPLGGMGLVLSPLFYYYLLMCQDPKNKVTLKNLVKSLFAKIKTAVTPSPAPVFQPVSE